MDIEYIKHNLLDLFSSINSYKELSENTAHEDQVIFKTAMYDLSMKSKFIEDLLNESQINESQINESQSSTFSKQDIKLTNKESEILSIMAQGFTNKELASAFSVSVKTIEFHISSIIKKLGATNRTEAINNAHKFNML